MHKRPTLLALLALVSLVAVSCGGTNDTGFPPTPTPEETGTENGDEGDTSTREDPFVVEDDTGRVEVIDNLFVPRFVQVSAGTTIVWEQTGVQPHNVVFDDESFDSHPDCGQQITSCMSQGDETQFTFEEVGEVAYYCVIHGRPGAPEDPANMAGVIIVG